MHAPLQPMPPTQSHASAASPSPAYDRTPSANHAAPQTHWDQHDTTNNAGQSATPDARHFPPSTSRPDPKARGPHNHPRHWSAHLETTPRSEERRVGKSVDLGGRRITNN